MAVNSALVVDDMMNLIILAVVRMGPLCRGIGSFSERKMWALALLRGQVLSRYPIL